MAMANVSRYATPCVVPMCYVAYVQLGTQRLPPYRGNKPDKLENRICRQIQDLHANFWHKREKEAQRLFVKLHIPSLLQGVESELIFALSGVYGLQFLRCWLIF